MAPTQEEDPGLGTVKHRLAFFDYSASNTNSAQDIHESASSEISLAAGETVMLGTCGLTDSAFTGDTYLRLYSPLTLVAASDDSEICGPDSMGSRLVYTALAAGIYTLRAGCFDVGACSGTVALSRRKATFAAPNLRNTHNATVNTFNKQYHFNGGEVIRVSTCGATALGANASGDTLLRIFQQSSGGYTTEVANNDNAGAACASAAEIVYSVPSAGYYQIRVGCAANTACSATVAVYSE
ncbi:hypothetical protein BON30_31600 [Cystobacter ferrugineus]|uniref:Peptidase C-terminal archaeal/bacterial domain-containing protein n=1 Tax=Cystobacter ferrugineus TaxID=83449 RepID=A0A1L9B437_9BACT|nr:hypothetical protein BON30_31600 [Cystobacter ferrugineus]